ncbi:MAG: hypothetical protein CM1200mP40_13670 [Gammaproteobacteria bacterium]|nr:MAG: hypothetical protein CM1200mP40_13670 [Gammaproteobacteria bacterium]
MRRWSRSSPTKMSRGMIWMLAKDGEVATFETAGLAREMIKPYDKRHTFSNLLNDQASNWCCINDAP